MNGERNSGLKMFETGRQNFLALIAIIFLAASFGANAAMAQTTLKYRPSLGAASPALDIYSFNGAKNAPVVIYVHGGAWQFGSRKRVNLKPDYFNKSGYIFVSVDYRLVPRVRVEDQFVDVDRALGWVYDNIAEYGGNKNNLHLMGHSAGAHLASMTGVNPGRRAAGLIRKGALRTIISNDTAAYDIPALAARRGGRLHRIYRAAFGTNSARWKRLSPQYQISSGRKLPAFLLLHSGQGNPAARKGVANSFADQLRKSGGRATLFDGRKYSHKEINVSIGKANNVTAAIGRFIKQNSR